MTKKGEEIVHLTLYEAGNSDRVSSRPVIYYHNSNSINIAIVLWLMETNSSSYAGRIRPHSKQIAGSRPHSKQIAGSWPTLYMPSDSKSAETPEATWPVCNYSVSVVVVC